MKFEDKRQLITIEEFRKKFCKDCYWFNNHGCDIERVTLEYCCHALVDQWKYKLI